MQCFTAATNDACNFANDQNVGVHACRAFEGFWAVPISTCGTHSSVELQRPKIRVLEGHSITPVAYNSAPQVAFRKSGRSRAV